VIVLTEGNNLQNCSSYSGSTRVERTHWTQQSCSTWSSSFYQFLLFSELHILVLSWTNAKALAY